MDFRNKHIDLVGKQNLWFGLSLAVIVVGMFSWAVFGLNLGIDFKGGGQLQYRIPYDKRPVAGQDVVFLNQARTALEKRGLQHVRLQVAGGNTLIVATDASGEQQLTGQQQVIAEALAPQLDGKDAQGHPELVTDKDALYGRQLVGPIIGRELRQNAVEGVLIGVLLIAGWIYVRYNFAGDGMRYAVAGIAALVHDVLVLVGLFALIGHLDPRVEVDGSFIAALLTVVGYSINDSVVIFDRLRENLRLRRKEAFNKVVNDSLLETMSRSINTGLTVIIMLLALLLLGGQSIYNFVLAMLVGIVSGLYSSIFNASMVLVAWHAYDDRKAAKKRAIASSNRSGQTGATGARPSLSNVNRGGLAASGASAGPATPVVPAPSKPAQPAAPTTDAPSGDAMRASDAPDESSEQASDTQAPYGAQPTRTPRKSRARRRF